MKNVFLVTKTRLEEETALKLIAKDQGQIDKYEGKPSVKFPCALISISTPKRKNLTQDGKLQLHNTLITVRLAFERLFTADSVINQSRLNLALQYYDVVEEVDNLLQGFKSGDMAALECVGCIEELRSDFDVMRLTFSTSYTKEYE